MKSVVFGMLAIAGLAAAASADVIVQNVTTQYLGPTGQGSGNPTDADPNAIYSNVDTGTGTGYAAGGSENQAGNQITRMVMDDANGVIGGVVNTFRFTVFNGNTAPVTARARFRLWNADGAGGAPGTYFNAPAGGGISGAIGFSFNPIAFAPGGTILTATLGPTQTFNMPAGNYWLGLCFDNNTGATGATAAQMDLLGQVTYNPPAVGSSADQYFQTTAAGSFFTTNNPAGATGNFGGNPAANFGWELVIPAPSSFALLGLGGLLAARRRR